MLSRHTAPIFGLATLTVALTFSVTEGSAQDATYLKNNASYCDIFRAISLSVPAECEPTSGLKVRSIRMKNDPAPVSESEPAESAASDTTATGGAETETAATDAIGAEASGSDSAMTDSQPDALSIALKIEFRFDSDQLTPEAKQVVDRLAEVISNDLMSESVIEIEGHADATGPDQYNLDLSLRRARAVRSYLNKTHSIRLERLPVSGKGEAEPYDPENPSSGINRRVEFNNLTG